MSKKMITDKVIKFNCRISYCLQITVTVDLNAQKYNNGNTTMCM